MHEHVTRNKSYNQCAQFADAILGFLPHKVPDHWGEFCATVTDYGRIISQGISGYDVN